MPHYCVPIENLAHDHTDPRRWTIAEYDLLTAQDAVQAATLDFPGGDMIVWAACAHLPSFDELRALRASYDLLIFNRKQKVRA